MTRRGGGTPPAPSSWQAHPSGCTPGTGERRGRHTHPTHPRGTGAERNLPQRLLRAAAHRERWATGGESPVGRYGGCSAASPARGCSPEPRGAAYRHFGTRRSESHPGLRVPKGNGGDRAWRRGRSRLARTGGSGGSGRFYSQEETGKGRVWGGVLSWGAACGDTVGGSGTARPLPFSRDLKLGQAAMEMSLSRHGGPAK